MNKQLIIGGLVAVLLAGWLGAALQPDPVTPAPQLGALTGPDIPYTYLNIGGVRHEYRSMAFTGATSTPCSVVSPAATSTLVRSVLQINTGSTTATTWHFASSTGPNATTSLLTNPISLGSGAQGTLAYMGTSTQPGITNGVNGYSVLPPSSYVTWGFQGVISNYTSDKLIGSCVVEFVIP